MDLLVAGSTPVTYPKFECVLTVETRLEIAAEDARKFGVIENVGDGREAVVLVRTPNPRPAGSTPAAVAR